MTAAVIPAKAGIQKTEVWIPNQVGDDIGVVFGNDSGDVIPAKAGIQEIFLFE